MWASLWATINPSDKTARRNTSDLQSIFAKYRPGQPRVPAGSRQGGQWTGPGGGTSPGAATSGGQHTRLADAGSRTNPRVLSDATQSGVKPGPR